MSSSFTYGMRAISGILHLEGVKYLICNKNIDYEMKMEADSGDIFSFKIKGNKVLLHIIWDNYRPKHVTVGCSTIEIEAENIYWEPIPDLKDPFW